MFSKFSSGTKVAMALMLAAGLGLQAQETLPAADRAEVGKYKANLQKQEAEAEALIEEAQKLFFAGNFEKAIPAYLEAQKIYVDLIRLNGAVPQTVVKDTDTPAAKRLKIREEQIRKQIAESYRGWAQQIALQAHEKSIAGDFDGAIANCRKAIEMYPECRKEVEARIATYEKMKLAADIRSKNSPSSVIPDLEDTDYRVAVLLKQAKILFYEGHFTEARQKYQDVLLLNNLQSEAIQGLQACNLQIKKYGDMRYITTHKRMMAEAVWKGILPIFPDQDAAGNTAGLANQKRGSGNSAITAMRQKLQGIVIPRIDFTNTPLNEAIETLRQRSQQIDPEGKGVNIFLIYRENELESASGLGGNLNMPDPFGGNAGFGGAPAGGTPRADNPAANPFTGQTAEVASDDDEFADEKPVSTINYPKVNLPLNNKTLLETLYLLADQCDLKVKIDANAVILATKGVALDDMYTDMYPFDQQLLSQLGGNYDPEKLKSSLRVRGIDFPDGSSVFAHEALGALFVTNTPDNLSKVDALLTQLMKDPVTLVQLQVKFVEIEQNDLKELGFIQTLSRPNGDAEGNTNGRLQFNENDTALRSLSNNTMFTYSRTGDGYNYNLTVNAANQLDSKDMLAAPTVLTLPGEEVYIEMEEYRFFAWDYDDSELTTTTNGNITTYVLKPQFPDFQVEPLGVSLSIRPEVDEEHREITMTVSPLLRELVGWSEYDYYTDEGGSEEPVQEKITRPIIAKRTTGTTVTVADNATVVLGGIVKDYTQSIDDKIPFLGDIPVIGRFFRSSGTKVTKTNLLIFITARMLETDGTPRFPESGASQMSGTERGVPGTGIPGNMR